MAKVYVLIEYNEEYAFGEMGMTSFASKEDAVSTLKADVEAFYGIPFEEVEEYLKSEGYEDVYVSETSVSISEDGDDYPLHWEIYEQTVEPTKLTLPLENGKSLVAEVNRDPDYPEIYLFIEGKDELVYQDLAFVRPKMTEDESDKRVQIPGEYEVAVYGDCNSEDYTKMYEVAEYVEEE